MTFWIGVKRTPVCQAQGFGSYEKVGRGRWLLDHTGILEFGRTETPSQSKQETYPTDRRPEHEESKDTRVSQRQVAEYPVLGKVDNNLW